MRLPILHHLALNFTRYPVLSPGQTLMYQAVYVSRNKGFQAYPAYPPYAQVSSGAGASRLQQLNTITEDVDAVFYFW